MHTLHNLQRLAVVTVAVLLTLMEAAAETTLVAKFSGLSCRDDCDSTGENVFFVGGVYDIQVTLRPDGLPENKQYQGVTDWGWPRGLELELGQSRGPTDSVRWSPTLTAAVSLGYHVPQQQIRRDSLWRATGELPPRDHRNPEYYFSFQVPPELAGTYVCVRAAWNHSTYGRIGTREAACMRIQRHCTEAGLQTVGGTYVYEAYQRGEYDRAVDLADSLIGHGWLDLAGLVTARLGARRAGRYEAALRFLDLCFQTYGVVELIEAPTELAAPSDAERRNYERIRGQLQELMNQQQQR